MADKIIRLNEGLPITHEDAVLDNNGVTIGSKVKQLQNDVADKVIEADKVQQILEDIKGSGDVPAATVAQVAENTGKLSELEGKVDKFTIGKSTHLLTISQGIINSSTGQDSNPPSASFLRSNYINAKDFDITIVSPYQYRVYAYGTDDQFLGLIQDWSVSPRHIAYSGASRYRLAFSKAGGAAINPSIFEQMGVEVSSRVTPSDAEKEAVQKNLDLVSVSRLNALSENVKAIADNVVAIKSGLGGFYDFNKSNPICVGYNDNCIVSQKGLYAKSQRTGSIGVNGIYNYYTDVLRSGKAYNIIFCAKASRQMNAILYLQTGTRVSWSASVSLGEEYRFFNLTTSHISEDAELLSLFAENSNVGDEIEIFALSTFEVGVNNVLVFVNYALLNDDRKSMMMSDDIPDTENSTSICDNVYTITHVLVRNGYSVVLRTDVIEETEADIVETRTSYFGDILTIRTNKTTMFNQIKYIENIWV